MIRQRLPALLLALSPVWVSASVYADEVTQVDPVAAIDAKITTKQSEIDALASEFDSEGSNLQQLKNEQQRLQQESSELEAKRNQAKSALDKQYSRLLDDPETDLASFQKQYQASWAALKNHQSQTLSNAQSISDSEMRLSQLKQRKARLKTEYANLEESRIDARVKRLEAELRESAVVETNYKTTCAPTMTLGECSSRGQHLTKQKAVTSFRAKLLDRLTESALAKEHLNGVELNIHIQESQVIRSGFEGDNQYFTQLQAKLQARPEAGAACQLLDVSSRYCLKGLSDETTTKKDKQWANVTVRSDQYDDTVTINGVNYGSTPVEIVLPAGRHQVTVTKDGYESYNRVITINGNDTVWVKLRPNSDG